MSEGSFAGELAGGEAPAPAPSGGNPEPSETTAPVQPSIEDATLEGYYIPLPDEYKDDPSFAKFRREDGTVDAHNLARSYKHAESLIGGEKVAVPKSDDDPEGWDRVYTALGRPAEATAYELERPELPDGAEYREEDEALYRDWAHENGLNQKQARNGYDLMIKHQMEQQAAYDKYRAESRDKCERELKRDEGQAFDSLVNANRVFLKKFGDEQFVDFLKENNLDNDPRMIRIMGRAGKSLMGDTQLEGGAGAANPAQIEKQIQDFRMKYNDALTDAYHPDHKARAAELQSMYPE